MSLFSLKNKSILITGSSKGIGKSIAHQSALMGAQVIISSRKIDACKETAKEINDDIKISAEDKRLIDSSAKAVIKDFIVEYEKLTSLSRDNVEPIIKSLINKHKTNFKGVGQPLRIALVGSRFGPGLYDVILSLDKAETIRRLNKI